MKYKEMINQIQTYQEEKIMKPIYEKWMKQYQQQINQLQNQINQ